MMKKFRNTIKRPFMIALAVLLVIGLIPVMSAQVVEAGAHRIYLEMDIRGSLSRPAAQMGRMNSHPDNGVFRLSGMESDFASGLTAGTISAAGAFTARATATYDISGIGVTYLHGIFGRRGTPRATLLVTGDGRNLGLFAVEEGEPPIPVTISIPSNTQEIIIRLETGSIWTQVPSAGFANAFFTTDPNFQPPTQQQPSVQSITITANALPIYGGTLSGYGTFNQGETVTLRAVPSNGWYYSRFDGWYEGNTRVNTNSTWSFTATTDRVLQARFTLIPPVTITATAGTGGTVTGDGIFNQGERVSLVATPNSGFNFIGWYENNTRVNTNARWNFNATANRTVQARFEEAQAQRFTITATAGTGGTVTGGGTFDQGMPVSLIATPNSGFNFTGWYENNTRVNANATWNFNATANRTLQARFAQATPTPSPTPIPTPTPSPTPTPQPQVTPIPTPVPQVPQVQPAAIGQHSDWARAELQRAAAAGIIPTTLQGSHVDLRDPITRGEFAGIVVRTFESLANTTALPAVTARFTDTSDPYVLRAYNAGLMVGMSPTQFEPNTLLNRETTATALTRSFKRATIPGWTFANDREGLLTFNWPSRFADDAQISYWARESVYFMAANGIILGTGNNRFSPRAVTGAQQAQGYASATREQALIIALRMVENLGR